MENLSNATFPVSGFNNLLINKYVVDQVIKATKESKIICFLWNIPDGNKISSNDAMNFETENHSEKCLSETIPIMATATVIIR